MTIIRGVAIENLKNHKYSGSDEGIIYKYFYNPVCNKIVECFPMTLAPNTLTLLGFVCIVGPFSLLLSISGLSFQGEVPSWFLYVHAAFYFFYRMFDELDGK